MKFVVVFLFLSLAACAQGGFESSNSSSRNQGSFGVGPQTTNDPQAPREPAANTPAPAPAPISAPAPAPVSAPAPAQAPAPAPASEPTLTADQILIVVNEVAGAKFSGSFINGGCDGANPTLYGTCTVRRAIDMGYKPATLAALVQDAQRAFDELARKGLPIGTPGVPYGTIDKPPVPSPRAGVRYALAAECKAAGMPAGVIACQLPAPQPVPQAEVNYYSHLWLSFFGPDIRAIGDSDLRHWSDRYHATNSCVQVTGEFIRAGIPFNPWVNGYPYIAGVQGVGPGNSSFNLGFMKMAYKAAFGFDQSQASIDYWLPFMDNGTYDAQGIVNVFLNDTNSVLAHCRAWGLN